MRGKVAVRQIRLVAVTERGISMSEREIRTGGCEVGSGKRGIPVVYDGGFSRHSHTRMLPHGNLHDDEILCLLVRHQPTIDQKVPHFDPLITLQLQDFTEVLCLVGCWRILIR